MVGYITTAHDIAQRLSEKWRHFVVHCLYSLFCTSPRCVGVRPEGWRAPLRGHLPHSALLIRRACYSEDLGTGAYATCGARSRRLGGCSRSFRGSRQGRRRDGRRSDAAAEATDQLRRRRSSIRW